MLKMIQHMNKHVRRKPKSVRACVFPPVEEDIFLIQGVKKIWMGSQQN